MNVIDHMPDELRPLARDLEGVGASARREGAAAAERIATRTAPRLRKPSRSDERMSRVSRLLLWAAGPAAIAAAAMFAAPLLRPVLPDRRGEPLGVEVVAANLERDIDTWLALDAAWSRDPFESSLAVLSLDAAGVAAATDDLPSFPDIDAGS